MISVFTKAVSQLNIMSHTSLSLVWFSPRCEGGNWRKRKLENLKIDAKEKVGSRIVG